VSRVLAPAPPAGANAAKRLARIVVPPAADLVILGDSNAAAWPPDLLAEELPGIAVFNFGLPGDRVQNALWRLDAVPTGHLRPRHVLIVLGTNNLADGDAPGEIAAGIDAVIEKVRTLWGEPTIILPAIARRGAGPLARSVEREALNALLLAKAGGGIRSARSDLILDAMGPAAFEPDGIHISRAGYATLTKTLAAMVGT
jgi:lysophospholipase L1-like esterase